METLLELQAAKLVAKVKHYLITMMGKVQEEASSEELYRALCYSLREEIMMHWTATTHTHDAKNARTLYYISLEYLPGRLLSNNITNMQAHPLMLIVLKNLGITVSDLVACESDPSLGNGGLGRLASCFLDSLATQNYPALAYGLRYQYGIFEQEFWEGVQIERPDCWLLYENPWEFRQDIHARNVRFSGRMDNPSFELHDYEEIRALPYDYPIVGYGKDSSFSVLTLRLWSTKESPRNFQLQRFNAGLLDEASENTTLTDVLYPNDNNEMGKRIRLKQEYLLVSASLQDIIQRHLQVHPDLSQFGDKVRIQINDTHPSLIIAEMMWVFTKEYNMPWHHAWEVTQQCVGYTNHTVLKEGLEDWNSNRLRTLLPCQYHIIERLNQKLCNQVRERFPGDEDKVRRMSIIEGGQVRMAHLAVTGSHAVNGVAALHTDILKKSLFKDFYDLFPEKFKSITNGITQRRWLLNCNPRLCEFITSRIGADWITSFPAIKKLEAFANDETSQKEFLEIKKANKIALIEHLHLHNRLRDYKGNFLKSSISLDPNSLFDVQIKRIHEYKRQLMNILHIIMTYHDLLENPGVHHIPRTILFGGKAAAGYDMAKDILQFIYCVARKINQDPTVNASLKIILIENYNVSKAEIIIPAADLSEQISTAGMEASGTGNMKLAINGSLTIGTDDGANVEMRKEITDKWWPFLFGSTSDEISEMRTKLTYNPWEILSNHPKIKRAVESLRDHSFAMYDSEHQAFTNIYYNLVESHYGERADKFFVLKDLPAYVEAQKKVNALYTNPLSWAEFAIHNIAGMGKFSVDEAVKQYADEIWNISPCDIDPIILEKIQKDYSALDQCRIH